MIIVKRRLASIQEAISGSSLEDVIGMSGIKKNRNQRSDIREPL
jgi:hypothetical protein